MSGTIILDFVGELSILLFLDNKGTVSIMPKSYYDQHEILHKHQKMLSPDYIIMHTGNCYMKVHFYIVIPSMM